MRIVLLMLAIHICVSCNIYDTFFSLKLKRLNSKFIKTEEYAIREKPILNIEYLIFLCWQINVYGDSYPDRVLDMLPKKKKFNYANHPGEDTYNEIFNNLTTDLFRGYTANARYLNYPVLGLTRFQVTEIQKWMSDRYNENLLIEFGYLNFNPDQRNQSCFVLESYLLGQYFGDARNGKYLDWKEGVFLPSFRSPLSDELLHLKNEQEDNLGFKEYKFNSKDFLWKWYNYYLKIDKSIGLIIFKLKPEFDIMSQGEFPLDEASLKDEVLYSETDIYENIDYLDNKRPTESNNFGKQSFVVIGKGKLNNPLVADQITYSEDTVLTNNIYWLSCKK